METLLKALLFVAALWAALVGLMALLQTPMLFPRSLVAPAPALPDTTERLRLTREGGIVLEGVRIAGRDPEPPLLLGFGGNAWNAEDVALFLHRIAPEHPVAAFHYRGYGPSTGRPSSAALIEDANAIHDLLAPEAPQGIIAVGFSIGSGIAAHLAAERPLSALVLVTPFERLSEVARASFPWAPVRLLFRHEMDALGALRESPYAPVALIVAGRDTIIPPSRADALATELEAAGRPARSMVTLDAGHNDIYGHPDFARHLRDALATVMD
ncbi:MAG: alpha/beta fold hydrolase [Rhodobacteraceae bacterium]|nr:MAG: alpha/beta fold hydrolase [Paracoccaceae bacterium]